MDARDTGESPFIVSILSTRIRACAGSSLCPFLYTLGVSVLYTIGGVVYMCMCCVYTIWILVILLFLIDLIRWCVIWCSFVYSIEVVVMCVLYSIG